MTTPELTDQVEGFTDDDEVEGDEWPFSIVPDWVTFAPLSSLAFHIYCMLRGYANKATASGAVAFPGQRKIANLRGYAKTQAVGAAIRELEEIGAVTRRFKATPRGRMTVYRTYLQPCVEYRGPRMTSDLNAPGVMEDLAAQRALRASSRGPRAKPTPDSQEAQEPQEVQEGPETQGTPEAPELPESQDSATPTAQDPPEASSAAAGPPRPHAAPSTHPDPTAQTEPGGQVELDLSGRERPGIGRDDRGDDDADEPP